MRTFNITIESTGKVIPGHEGETIKESLDRADVFFPNNCGGKGKCLSCRIEYTCDAPEMTEIEKDRFDPDSNIRMSCQHVIEKDIDILISGFSIRDDQKRIYDFRITDGGEGFGIAVDLGTTQIALYLIDLLSGKIVSQYSFLNPQIKFGGDVMSRLDAAKQELHREEMTNIIHQRIGEVVSKALTGNSIDKNEVKRVFIAGNSVMSHLWLGFGGEGLERVPFRSVLEGRGNITFDPAVVGLSRECRSEVCSILSGFIGGDITAAILASDLDIFSPSTPPRLLIDLGTNGEIVLSANGNVLAASTAAGPAFEGIGMFSGMSAQSGAIEGFSKGDEPIVINGGAPIGFCGSGYIAAIEMLLRKRILSPTGLLNRNSNDERKWSPDHDHNQPPFIIQDDVRKFQLAKGAVAAGIRILCKEAKIGTEDIGEVILTGSFGNRVDIKAAINIGLLPDIPVRKVAFIDNAAGRGAALCLGDDSYRIRAEELQAKVKVINLGENPDFEELFVANMHFSDG